MAQIFQLRCIDCELRAVCWPWSFISRICKVWSLMGVAKLPSPSTQRLEVHTDQCARSVVSAD